MKDLMSRVIAFITFDYPLDANYISTQYGTTHSYYKKEMASWSTKATKQKVVAAYWIKYVLPHFAVLFGLPALLMFLLPAHFNILFLAVVFAAGLITFPVILLFLYWPGFHSNFLPYLETVKESFENNHLEQIEKCRQAQLPNFSLALFFYAITKTNSLKFVQCNDQSANLLMKLYGVDAGSLKKNLELILVASKRKNMTERKITELRNRFSETLQFMEELQFTAGIEELKKLEQQFFSR